MRAPALAALCSRSPWCRPAARADGDPASDVLLQQDVFLPYSVPTSQGTATALTELTKRAAKAGWPVKVGDHRLGPNDLGSAAQYASDPQGYANFLASSSAAAGGARSCGCSSSRRSASAARTSATTSTRR